MTDVTAEHTVVSYRRRPLALLSILAASGERGISRERLLLYLWPESNARHGRNTLSQTLYALKRDLGGEQLVGGTTVLTLNRTVVRCDLWEFERAIASGADAEAVSLYAGPFLHDFTIPGLREFEQWVTVERHRLDRLHRGALQRLATSAEERGDPTQAVHWWRRLVDAAPLSTTAAMGLIRALASAGDRSAALDHARAYAALVRTELDSEPESAVVALIDRIRRTGTALDRTGPDRTATGAAAPRSVPAAAPTPGTPPALAAPPATTAPSEPPPESTRAHVTPERAADSPAAPQPVADPAAESVVRENVTPVAPVLSVASTATPSGVEFGTRREWSRSLRLAVVTAALAIVATIVAAVLPGGMGIRPQPPSVVVDEAVPSVAVLPFTTTAPDSMAGRAAQIVEMLTAALRGADVELVDSAVAAAIATRASPAEGAPPADPADDDGAPPAADSYVTGEIALTGSRVRVTARWYDLDPERARSSRGRETLITSAVAEGEPARIPEMVEQLAAQLLANRHAGPSARLVRDAATGTRKLDAFKAFLRGEQLLRRLEYASAIDEFARAVATDSGFALAHYRLGTAAHQAGRAALARASAERAAARAGGLANPNRSLVRAFALGLRGDVEDAERLYESVVDDYPDEVEAWFHLAHLRFHGNPLVGRSALEARGALARATRLDPEHRQALVLLARVAAAEARPAAVDSLLARVAEGRDADARSTTEAVQALAQLNPDLLWAAVSTSPRGTRSLRSALAVGGAVAPSAIAEHARPLTRPDNAPEVRARGYQILARASAARGQWSVASALLDSTGALDPAAALELRAHLASAPFLRVPVAGLRQIVSALSGWQGDAQRVGGETHAPEHAGLHAHIRLHALGLLLGAMRESARAERLADSIERLPVPESTPPEVPRVLAQSVRATAAFHAGRHADVVRILGSTPWPAVALAFESEVHDRFLRAESLLALGHPEDAARWYATIAQRAVYEQVYLAPSELRLGEIEERRGDLAQAALHYRRFVELWSSADSTLQPQVAIARQRLGALPVPAELGAPRTSIGLDWSARLRGLASAVR